MQNMFVRQNAAPAGANANTVSYRLRVNGVDTALVVSRAANAGIGTSSNVTDTVTIAQGDRIALVAVKALGIGNGSLEILVAVEFA
jgi:hypothetical protein